MVKEAYCSLEVSNLLKEKGFNNDYPKDNCTQFACTHQMAMSWLREKEIFIVINYSRFYKTYRYNIYSMNIDVELDCTDYSFKSYEDACNAALLYSLENLI